MVLVGEMRDLETAQIAIRAALTGHLVFSTLHTNDAPSTVTRLQDMGIPPFLISSSLLLVIAQRLVRRSCLECREQVQVPVSALIDIGFRPEDAEGVRVYSGKGCAACANTGYKGRISIHEIMWMVPELQEAIVRQRPANELKRDRRESRDADPAADRAPESGERAHHDRRGPPRDVRRLRAKGEQT